MKCINWTKDRAQWHSAWLASLRSWFHFPVWKKKSIIYSKIKPCDGRFHNATNSKVICEREIDYGSWVRERSERRAGHRWSNNRALHREGERKAAQQLQGQLCAAFRDSDMRGPWLPQPFPELRQLQLPRAVLADSWLRTGLWEMDPWSPFRPTAVSRWMTIVFCIRVTERVDILFLFQEKKSNWHRSRVSLSWYWM